MRDLQERGHAGAAAGVHRKGAGPVADVDEAEAAEGARGAPVLEGAAVGPPVARGDLERPVASQERPLLRGCELGRDVGVGES